MKFEKPKNENYCATVTEIKNIVPLENCDNIQGTIIFGNHVIVGKDVQIGNVGIYFPPETQLSNEYLSENNLYRDATLNKDQTKKGYFEVNGRVRTAKLRGHQSCGIFMPLSSLQFTGLTENDFKVGDIFDIIKDKRICNKYIIPQKQQPLPGSKKKRKRIKISKTIENQFRFHEDTLHLGKNIHRFSKNDIVSITYKLHGTSVVISKVLCKKKLSFIEKLLKKFNINIVDNTYDNLYASRNVIKNDDMNGDEFVKHQGKNHYYKSDIWGLANEKLQEYLLDGMTIYAEIVGFIPETGAYIQKGYDYGCNQKEFEVYIYRITYTNPSGNVFEFSWSQLTEWCKSRGLKHVPEYFYGNVNELLNDVIYDKNLSFNDNLFNIIKKRYVKEENCIMCNNPVPREGVVVRREVLNFEAYKLKTFLFLDRETKQHDKGEEDIEEAN